MTNALQLRLQPEASTLARSRQRCPSWDHQRPTTFQTRTRNSDDLSHPPAYPTVQYTQTQGGRAAILTGSSCERSRPLPCPSGTLLAKAPAAPQPSHRNKRTRPTRGIRDDRRLSADGSSRCHNSWPLAMDNGRVVVEHQGINFEPVRTRQRVNPVSDNQKG